MLARAACGLGIGLVAGVVGTAAITVSQLIAMRIQGRTPSRSPAKAVEKVFAIRAVDDPAEARLAQWVHWGYGTSWGSVRGLMTVFGLRGPWADTLHWGAVQGTALVMLPGLKVAPPVRQWGAGEVVLEGVHHAVYVTAVGLTSDALCRRLAAREEPRRIPWSLLLGGAVAESVRRRRARRAAPAIAALPEVARTWSRTVAERLPVGAGR